MNNRYRFITLISQEGQYFVARCVELGVVSQGHSVEEATSNLREAVDLYLEDFSPDELKQYASHPAFVSSLEFEHV